MTWRMLSVYFDKLLKPILSTCLYWLDLKWKSQIFAKYVIADCLSFSALPTFTLVQCMSTHCIYVYIYIMLYLRRFIFKK